VAPSGLYARLCHAFLVFNYLHLFQQTFSVLMHNCLLPSLRDVKCTVIDNKTANINDKNQKLQKS